MRADRLLHILLLLQRHSRLTSVDLAARLEVSERTILRDMGALSTAGVPVYTERGRNGGCVLMPGYRAEAGDLTPREAQALFAWTGQSTMSDLGLGGPLRSALAKLSATVSTEQLGEVETLRDVLVIDHRPWFAEPESVATLPTVRNATTSRRRVRLRYATPGRPRPVSRTVDPWGLIENAGRWYLVAGHRRSGRLYRVSRIRGVEVLDEAAHRPVDLDLSREWQLLRAGLERSATASTSVVVRVRPDAERLVRQVCGPQLAMGTRILPVVGVPAMTTAGTECDVRAAWPSLAMDFRVRSAAIGVLLGFSDAVVVDSPGDLRDEIAAAAQRVMSLYT